MAIQSSATRHWHPIVETVHLWRAKAGGQRKAARPEDEMADLTLAASRRIALPPAQWAHDIRNLLTTIGLHLDSLERLAGPQGTKAAGAMHTLIARAAVMCSEAV